MTVEMTGLLEIQLSPQICMMKYIIGAIPGNKLCLLEVCPNLAISVIRKCV